MWATNVHLFSRLRCRFPARPNALPADLTLSGDVVVAASHPRVTAGCATVTVGGNDRLACGGGNRSVAAEQSLRSPSSDRFGRAAAPCRTEDRSTCRRSFVRLPNRGITLADDRVTTVVRARHHGDNVIHGALGGRTAGSARRDGRGDHRRVGVERGCARPARHGRHREGSPAVLPRRGCRRRCGHREPDAGAGHRIRQWTVDLVGRQGEPATRLQRELRSGHGRSERGRGADRCRRPGVLPELEAPLARPGGRPPRQHRPGRLLAGDGVGGAGPPRRHEDRARWRVGRAVGAAVLLGEGECW